MLNLIMVFMIIVVLSFAGTLLFRQRFEYVLPVTIFSIILAAYVLASFDILKWLSAVLTVFSIISMIYVVIHLIANKAERAKSMQLLFTSGFFLFFLMSSLLVVYNYGRMFTLWDEFTHWGLTVKNMFSLDSFAIGSKANTVFQDYPPAMSLFQYFFTLFDKTFIEAHVIQSSAIFSASLLLAMFPRRRNANWMIFLIMIGVFCLFILAFYPHHFDQVYVDGILSILFAYIFLRVIDPAPWDRFRIAEITLGCMVLTLVKSTGFFLALLAVVAMLIHSNAKLIKHALFPIAGIALVKTSWSWIVMDVGSHFDITKISSANIIDFILGNGGYRYEVVRNFFSAFILKPISIFGKQTIFFGVTISYVGYAILISLILYLIARKLNDEYGKQITFVVGFLFIGFVSYAFALLFMYLFNFSEYEALRVASFGRYIGSFALAYSLIWVSLLTDIYSQSMQSKLENILLRKYAVIGLTIFLILTGVAIFPKVKSRLLSWQSTQGMRAPYSQIEKYREILKPDDRVYLISQHSQGYDYWVLRYNLTPTLSQNGFGFWSLGGKYDESDVWFRNISISDWKLELQSDYEYVYLFNVDERFKSMYGALFASLQDILPRSMYRVVTSETGPILYLIDRSE